MLHAVEYTGVRGTHLRRSSWMIVTHALENGRIGARGSGRRRYLWDTMCMPLRNACARPVSLQIVHTAKLHSPQTVRRRPR